MSSYALRIGSLEDQSKKVQCTRYCMLNVDLQGLYDILFCLSYQLYMYPNLWVINDIHLHFLVLRSASVLFVW